MCYIYSMAYEIRNFNQIEPKYLKNINLKCKMSTAFHDLFFKGEIKFFNIRLEKSITGILLETTTFLLIFFFVGLLLGQLILLFNLTPIQLKSKDHIGAFLALFAAFYWGRVNRHGSQWLYCATSFNRIFQDLAPIKDDDALVAHLFKRTMLAIDLIDCDLWDHKTFKHEFTTTLEIALNFHKLEYSGEEKYIQKTKDGTLLTIEARNIIGEFSVYLEKCLVRLEK